MKTLFFLAILGCALNAQAQDHPLDNLVDIDPQQEKIFKQCEKELNEEFAITPKEILREDICRRIVRMKNCDITESDIDQYIYLRFMECVVQKSSQSGGDDDGA